VRIFNFLLFEQSITAWDGESPFTTTDDRFNALLGCADRLALHVMADQIAAAATLTVALSESADGVTWISRPVVGQLVLAPGAAAQMVVRDAGTAPGLGLVRVMVVLAGSGAKARVRIWATGRDHGSSRPRM
jgi:hypothetical protein